MINAHQYDILVHMDKHRFHLILSRELWERIKAIASRNRRPVTQEIILAIEEHLDTAEKAACKGGAPKQ